MKEMMAKVVYSRPDSMTIRMTFCNLERRGAERLLPGMEVLVLYLNWAFSLSTRQMR